MNQACIRCLLPLFVYLLSLPLLAEPYTIKVGAVLPLSGDLAYVGKDIQEGVILALEERVAAGQLSKDVAIEFFWEDGKFSPKDSVLAAQRLISSKNVDVIVSLWDTADVIAPLTEKAHVVHLSIRWNPDVTTKHQYTFTFESTFPTYYADMVALIKKQDIGRVVFIHEQTQAGERERACFQSEADKQGLKVLAIESFPTGERDFRGVLTRLLSKDPEMVVNEGFPPASVTLLRQLRTLRPTMKHIGFYEVIAERELIEGQPFISQLGFLPDFSAKFEKRFGHSFKIRAPHGYEIVKILDWAYGSASSETKPPPSFLRDKLETLKDFPSVLGNLSVNETRNIEHPNTAKIYRNGTFEPYQ